MARRDRYGRDKMSPELAALTRVWYAKLKETGFHDIEPHPDRLAVNSYLDGHHIEARKRAMRGATTGKSELFRLADRWVHDEQWRTRAERTAWVLWSRGYDLTEVYERVARLGKKATFLWRHAQRVKAMNEFYKAELAREALDIDPDEIDEDEFAPTRIQAAFGSPSSYAAHYGDAGL